MENSISGPTAEQLTKLRELKEKGYRPDFELSMAHDDIAFVLVAPNGKDAGACTADGGFEMTTVDELRKSHYDPNMLEQMRMFYGKGE
jgi:hypothetical protein